MNDDEIAAKALVMLQKGVQHHDRSGDEFITRHRGEAYFRGLNIRYNVASTLDAFPPVRLLTNLRSKIYQPKSRNLSAFCTGP
jgi:hypothetical protein